MSRPTRWNGTKGDNVAVRGKSQVHNFVLFYLGSRFTFQTRSVAQRVLTAPRRQPNDEVTKHANVRGAPRDTRQCSQTGLVVMTSTRGPSKGPVSRAMVSDDWFRSTPEMLQINCLIVPASLCTPTSFLTCIPDIRKENDKKTIKTSAMHSDTQAVCVWRGGGGGGEGGEGEEGLQQLKQWYYKSQSDLTSAAVYDRRQRLRITQHDPYRHVASRCVFQSLNNTSQKI